MSSIVKIEQEMQDNTEADDDHEVTINMNSCRICLKTSNQPMCVLYERLKSVSYADMLRCVTRIKASKEDELPDKICYKCRAALERAFIFKAVAEKSDARLKLLKQIDYDFSTHSVKIENLDSEGFENEVYTEDYEGTEDCKGDGADSVDVKQEVFIEYSDEIALEGIEEYLEDGTENEELDYDGDFYNSEDEGHELELYTTGLEENEDTALEENSQFQNESNKKVAKRKDTTTLYKSNNSPRAKRKTRKRRQSLSESQDREKHICPICGLLVVYLTQHMKSHNERVIQCPECPKTFHKRSNLRTHLKYHKGTKNYVCSVCGMAFYDNRALIRHSSKHTGVKPYSCELCNKTFVANNTLKLHMEIHAGTKRYKCEVCGTSFRVPHQLKAHSIIHTGDKPYHCQICNIGFGYKVKLNNHVQKEHDINLKFKSVHTFTRELFLEAKSETEPNAVHFIDDENEFDGDVDQTGMIQEIDETGMILEEIDETGIEDEINQTGLIQEEINQTGMTQEEIDQAFMNQDEIEQDQLIICAKGDASDSDERLVLSMIMPDGM